MGKERSGKCVLLLCLCDEICCISVSAARFCLGLRAPFSFPPCSQAEVFWSPALTAVSCWSRGVAGTRSWQSRAAPGPACGILRLETEGTRNFIHLQFLSLRWSAAACWNLSFAQASQNSRFQRPDFFFSCQIQVMPHLSYLKSLGLDHVNVPVKETGVPLKLHSYRSAHQCFVTLLTSPVVKRLPKIRQKSKHKQCHSLTTF